MTPMRIGLSAVIFVCVLILALCTYSRPASGNDTTIIYLPHVMQEAPELRSVGPVAPTPTVTVVAPPWSEE